MTKSHIGIVLAAVLLLLALAACTSQQTSAPQADESTAVEEIATEEIAAQEEALPTSTPVEEVVLVPTDTPDEETEEKTEAQVETEAVVEKPPTAEPVVKATDWTTTASVDGDYVIRGNPNAPIRLIDYSDFL